MSKRKIIIEINGGNLDCISSDDPCEDIEIVVIDWDNDGQLCAEALREEFPGILRMTDNGNGLELIGVDSERFPHTLA